MKKTIFLAALVLLGLAGLPARVPARADESIPALTLERIPHPGITTPFSQPAD